MEEVRSIQKEVAEGVFTATAARQLCDKLELDLPIIKATAAILEGKVTATQALQGLLKIPVGEEIPVAIFVKSE